MAREEGRISGSFAIRLFIGLLLLAALFAVVFNFAELRRFADLLRSAEPGWLVLAVLFQLSTYVSVAATWAVVLRAAGTPRSMRSLVPLSLSKLFADQAVPTAGMSGNILLVNQLIRSGLPRGNAVTALLLSIAGYYLAYGLLALTVLILLWLHAKATVLLASAVTALVVIAIMVGGFALWLGRGGDRHLPSFLRRIAPVRQLAELVREAPGKIARDPKLIAASAAFNALIFLADAATLQMCLLALGQGVTFNTTFIALIMASIAVTLGPIPLGLGTFEAVCIAMLRLLGTPLEAAVAGTLLLRGFTLWLPLLPGFLLTRRMLRA